MSRSRAAQRGVSALLMIALIVMIGAVVAASASLTTGVHGGLARDLSAAQATQAARGGLEWARFQWGPAGGACAGPVNVVLPLAGPAMTVTVTCVSLASTNEDGTPVNVFRVTANACNRPAAGRCPNALATADYVESEITALVYR